MCSNPWAVRNRSISSSGLIPGSSLRNTFSTSRSSNTTDEFDCSTPISARGRRPRRASASAVDALEAEAALVGLDLVGGLDPPQQLDAPGRDRRARRTRSSRRSARSTRRRGACRRTLARGAERERQLVELVRAGREPRLHERQQQQRVLAQRRRSRRSRCPATCRDLDAYQRCCCDPVAQALVVEQLGELDAVHARRAQLIARASSSSTSSNQ